LSHRRDLAVGTVLVALALVMAGSLLGVPISGRIVGTVGPRALRWGLAIQVILVAFFARLAYSNTICQEVFYGITPWAGRLLIAVFVIALVLIGFGTTVSLRVIAKNETVFEVVVLVLLFVFGLRAVMSIGLGCI
jgi:hypothetical protein